MHIERTYLCFFFGLEYSDTSCLDIFGIGNKRFEIGYWQERI